MQSVKIPSEICVKLDKINRNFLQGHIDTKKATHLINWDTVCLLKKWGGLGIKFMKGMNQSLLAKIGWRIVQDDKGIWCKLLKSKYLHSKTIVDQETGSRIVCSSTWKGITFGAKLIN
ncbi:hypothetical protein Ddye_031242 [Dipteronia dyeriana]|uniref:Uncharacterized protein n=1 Tax=Dipteronia dyeriana TaxID=168575 RepID=A0AAD9WNI1_9ROSI|nr:hypothetical protein Ddye_031242 [Dipteronia dyeriana]